MADLVVKDVDDAIVRALRRRAGIHGRSEEAEHRAILAAWLPITPCGSLAERLMAIPGVGRDADFEREPRWGPGSGTTADEGGCT
jgi:plasmid stability protein